MNSKSRSPDNHAWTEDDFYKLARSLSQSDLARGKDGIVSNLHYSKKLNRYTCHLLFEPKGSIELNFNIDFGAGYPMPNDIEQYNYIDPRDEFIGGHDKFENFQLGYEKSEINEGLRQGDLQDVVSPVISIDEYKSKILNDDDSIVVVFRADTQEVAYDLSSFIEKSPFDFIDTEVSEAPDTDGMFLIFAEIKRDKKFFQKMKLLINALKKLSFTEEWKFTALKMTSERPLTVKELQNTIRVEELEKLPPVEELNEELSPLEKSDLEVLHWMKSEI